MGGIRCGKVYPPDETINRRDVLAEPLLVTLDVSRAVLTATIANRPSNAFTRSATSPPGRVDAGRPPVARSRSPTSPLDRARTYSLAAGPTNDRSHRDDDGRRGKEIMAKYAATFHRRSGDSSETFV